MGQYYARACILRHECILAIVIRINSRRESCLWVGTTLRHKRIKRQKQAKHQHQDCQHGYAPPPQAWLVFCGNARPLGSRAIYY